MKIVPDQLNSGSAETSRIHSRAATPVVAPSSSPATTAVVADARRVVGAVAGTARSVTGDDPARDAAAGVTGPVRGGVGPGDRRRAR